MRQILLLVSRNETSNSPSALPKVLKSPSSVKRGARNAPILSNIALRANSDKLRAPEAAQDFVKTSYSAEDTRTVTIRELFLIDDITQVGTY
jgi:hypothetical protein